MKDEPTNLKGIWIRIIFGFSIGFILFCSGSIILLAKNGWLHAKSNLFAGPPPIMTASVLGFFGGVAGSLLSLIQWKRIKEKNKDTKPVV